MVVGAGRSVTRRTPSACAALCAAAALSSRTARARALPRSRTSPRLGSSSARAASTSRRCSTVRQAVSWQTIVARHSVVRPAARCAMVCGSSPPPRARASPRCREPRLGDSCRASASCAPTPRPSCSFAAPRERCNSICQSAKATDTRACAAATAPFTASRPVTRSIRCASDRSTCSDGSRSTNEATSAGVSAGRARAAAADTYPCSNIRPL